MEKKEYIVGVDIGSSSVVMSVGKRDDKGEITVLGVEVQEVDESVVKCGDIVNFVDLG
jgi:cell division ATPase FtsA